MKIGANYYQKECEFLVWAPGQSKVSLVLPEKNQVLKMDPEKNGYWRLVINNIEPKTRYMFRLEDDISRPDPSSHYQPDGVFGPSLIMDHSSFSWKDANWHGINFEEMIIYEIHTGTFSASGTFAGVTEKASEFSELGVNAVELMPISQFSGARNWGYDAVFPFAVQNTYGGPDELKVLVNEFHSKGIAVILDVVYNHLGPEGSILKYFGPYFLVNQVTPWGASINFDGVNSSQVRNFFFENAIYWFKNYHIDALRLDAVFAILDKSPSHFLKELSEKVEDFSKTISKKLVLVGENGNIDSKLLQPRNESGYGLDALWHDDFHHSLHGLLTGEKNSYYNNFGSLGKFIEVLNQNYFYSNTLAEKDPGGFKKFVDPSKLVVFSQNHDQIGNRPLGDRLITIAGFEASKLAAGLVLLSPFIPLLFMGEEYGEFAPFLFFTNYFNPYLGIEVRDGRERDLRSNYWNEKPIDPQDPIAFNSSKLDWQKRYSGKCRLILEYYKKLIKIRRDLKINKFVHTKFIETENTDLLIIQRTFSNSILTLIANFSKSVQDYRFSCQGEGFEKILDSADIEWAGPGSLMPRLTDFGTMHSICPLSITVFVRKNKN